MQIGLYVGLISFCVFVPVSLIRGMVLPKRYYRYLRQNHPKVWEDITTVFGIGPGMRNSYRGLKFFLSHEDIDDTNLRAMKASVRNAIIYFFTGSVGIFIILAIIVKLSTSK